MTGRAKKVIEEMATLSPAELADVLGKFGLPVSDDGRRVCRNADLLRFIDSHPPDPEFADDIEAGVRERRARAEHRVSPWDR
jgi:hypothetical protein